MVVDLWLCVCGWVCHCVFEIVVPTAICHLRLRSRSAHCDLALAG